MPLNNGEVFAGYVIQRLLGAGGMGEVYLAQHPRLPRQDALKILSTASTVDTDFGRDSFARPNWPLPSGTHILSAFSIVVSSTVNSGSPWTTWTALTQVD